MTAGVVIAGGGLAAQRCAETLRRGGYEGRVRLICGEVHRPYDRPPLSKGVLADASAEHGLSFRPAQWYDDQAVELMLGVRVCGVDPVDQSLRLSNFGKVGYERLLIATGSRARRLPNLEGFSNVSTLRTREDGQALRSVLRPGVRLAVVGAGFIGQEVAAAARRAGAQVTVIEPAAVPLVAMLGPGVGEWFANLHREEGVELHLGVGVGTVHGQGEVRSLTLTDGRLVSCDHVLVGVGVTPDLSCLRGSGLDRTGVRTDADGRSERHGIFAAGDAAATFDPLAGRHVLGGHWESAGRQGARVARAMLGREQGPPPPASFWSDLYGIRVQYLGQADRADRVSIDGGPGSRQMRATFTREGRPVAILLAGRPQELPEARALLSAAAAGAAA